jgi:DNA-binding beta-propeller fold protein YncE
MHGVSVLDPRLLVLAMMSLAACRSSQPAAPGPAPLEDTPAAIPEGARVAVSASVASWDRQRSGVWVANGDAGSISFFDPATSHVLHEIVTGGNLTSVAVAPDGRWVAAVDRESATVLLVDPDAGSIVRRIAVGSHPRSLVFDPAEPRWFYVTIEDDDSVAVIDRTNAGVTGAITVGPLPAALAASSSRRELIVIGRTDGHAQIVSTEKLAVTGTIALGDSPPLSDPKQPQGRPYGFEGVALAPDQATLWVPHMLYSGSHPIQFQSTVFPAVSVLDLVGGSEITNEGAAKNKFPGRKMLFEAINVIGDTGEARVISQPCAAAVHPNGLRAYVLACGSEDLVVFDVPSGRAVEMLSGDLGDHPVGLALDPAGSRAFVVADQSHTLTVVDLAGGDVLGHPHVVGTPTALVASDPTPPDLRAGKTLFLRANKTKGDLATTGDSWMSCGACHLDGLVSTNRFLMEASHPDAKTDALVGHHRLSDMFATAPKPDAPDYQPHDVLAAFLDQGGLAPDRSGKDRTGEVSLEAPPAAAASMAKNVARVVALDLPFGPSWLLPAKVETSLYDGEWCAKCHQKEYDAWTRSAHAHAAEDPFVAYVATTEVKLRGPSYERLCQGCHDPTGLRLGKASLSGGAGVTCRSCHDVTRLLRAGGNADVEVTDRDWTVDHKGKGGLDLLRRPDFCGGCHQQFVPGHALRSIDTLTEWETSPYHGPGVVRACVDCHMPRADGVANHSVVGGNLALAQRYPVPGWEDAIVGNLATSAKISASWQGSAVAAKVENVGAGHLLPTGVADIREMWVEIEIQDAAGNKLATVGGPDANGLLADDGPRFGMDIAGEDGTLLKLHELSLAKSIPFDRRVSPGGAQTVTVELGALPAGAASAVAHLYYRNLRPPFYRAALGDPSATPPTIELAKASVSGAPTQ